MARTSPPIVIAADSRPAGVAGECFYCRQLVGSPHSETCVLWTRKVLVRFEITMPVDTPHSWTEEDINFHFQDSSWCASNVVEMLQELENSTDNGCLCPYVTAEYVGEVEDAKN